MEASAATASAAGLIGSVSALATTLRNLKQRYDFAVFNITRAASSLWTAKSALEAIQEWSATAAHSASSSPQLDADISLTLESCAVLVAVIERKLGETDVVKVFDKSRIVVLDATLKDFTSHLDVQIRALQLLLTIFQWCAGSGLPLPSWPC
jgi:hypothetical protein